MRLEPLFKHSKTFNGDVKNLSKKMKMKDKGELLLLQEFNITINY